ncbi:MAG: GNAT family N-acetyltransferase [Methanosphaera sp. rholeuAM6]|nr:MAG: GNAT family N-acetyltransferase [Methanosphaera sp. rholeuAM6]
MHIQIMELKPELIEKYQVKDFLFTMIKSSYGLDYVPEFHYDVMNLEKYYLNPERSNFFIAVDKDKDLLVGTSAIRGYDKDYHIENKNYTLEKTASIYRMFVEEDYRRCKIASKLLKNIESFCREKDYTEIYLHTQKNSTGALPFWLKNNYQITKDMHNEWHTVHMEKILTSLAKK